MKTNKKTFRGCFKINTHRNLHISLFLSLFIGLTSIVACIISPSGKIDMNANNWVYPFRSLFSIWRSISHFIVDGNIDLLSIISSTLISGFVILHQGKNKLLILQIKTLNTYIWLIEKILSFVIYPIVILVLLHAKHNNRTSIAALSFISIIISLLYLFGYIARCNNDKSYYLREVCGAIVITSDNDKKSERFMDTLFPSVKNEYNELNSDIEIIEYFVFNTNIESVSTKSIFNNGETEISINYAKKLELELIQNYMTKIITPLTARLRRMYENDPSKMLYEFVKHIANTKHSNVILNLIFQIFVRYTIKEYEISRINHHTVSEKNETINDILLVLNNTLPVENYNDFRNYIIPTKHNAIEVYEIIEKVIYSYLNYMQELSMLSIVTYVDLELKYMQQKDIYSCHKNNNTINLCYNTFDIVAPFASYFEI